VRALIDVHRLLLVPQHGVIEADRVADLQAIRGVQRDTLVALLELNRAKHLDRLARRSLRLHAGILNQVHPRGGAAVHDGDFAVIQFDADIVDAEGAKRREQVLDRLDGGLARTEAGLELLAAAQVRHVSWNLDAPKIRPPESDTRVDRCRHQGHGDLLSRVEPDACAVDRTAERSL
jgi:hypothetical protein